MTAADDDNDRLRAVALHNVQSIFPTHGQPAEALREQSDWLRVTLASIGDAVISTDGDGKITFMNGVAEQLTGWTQADALQRPLADVFQIVNEHTRAPVENPALR